MFRNVPCSWFYRRPRKYQRRFFFEEVTFDHVPGKEKDQVSPMFISEQQRKTSVCRFCKITQLLCFFFVISKVCWTVCVFRFLNLGSLKRVHASLFTSRDFRHRRAMILKVERNIKTLENRGKELYNVWMHFSLICCQKCERQCSNNDIIGHSLGKKKKIISIHYLTGQNRGLSSLKNIWPVMMTGNLLSVIFSPDVWVFFPPHGK